MQKDNSYNFQNRNSSFFEKLISKIADVIVIIDENGIIKYKSPNTFSLFGWDPKSQEGTLVFEYLHPDDVSIAKAFFQSLLANKGITDIFECRYRRKNGKYEIIEFTGTNLIDDPDINGVLGCYHIITERKRAEQERKESEERFKALHNASFGGIIVHDKGLIIDCNKGLEDMTGYTSDELIGMDGMQLIAEKSRKFVMAQILRGYEKPYEAWGLRKSGEEFPARLEARNIPYKGKSVRTVEFRDLTAKKASEKEKEKLRAQLIQSQKLESVGRLAGGVAHDFNNMLTVIIGYAQSAIEEIPETSSLYTSLNEILSAASRSSEITAQLLAFARKQTVLPKIIDLNEAISFTLKMLRRLIGENIDLFWNPCDTSCKIKIDPTQIDQILTNLIVNSRDAISGVGKIYIETNIAEISEFDCKDSDFLPGNYIKLSVSDSGSGMTAETQKKIFEPFYTTKKVGEGTGLGLATVYGIVKQNNGFITVYSELNQGTTFNLYFPHKQDEGGAVVKNQIQQANIKGNETILLVEDEPAILKMAERILTKQGYNVLATVSTDIAIDFANKNRNDISLLISDIIMPKMNGKDLAEKIKEIIPAIKILFVSGYTENIIAHQGIIENNINFIQKPFQKQDFLLKVREILDENLKSSIIA